MPLQTPSQATTCWECPIHPTNVLLTHTIAPWTPIPMCFQCRCSSDILRRTAAGRKCWYRSRLIRKKVLSDFTDKRDFLSHSCWKVTSEKVSLLVQKKCMTQPYLWRTPTLPIGRRTLRPYTAAMRSTCTKIMTSLQPWSSEFLGTENSDYYFSVSSIIVH